MVAALQQEQHQSSFNLQQLLDYIFVEVNVHEM